MILRAIRLEDSRSTNPQGDVETVLERIDILVAQHELDAKLGIALHELGDRRPKPQRAERHRRIDSQQSARCDLRLGDGLVRRLELADDAEHALEIGLPIFGRADAARGAVQKLHAEFVLELTDIFADRGPR
ncbi:hypothetical protein GCM10007857_11270 [Bradyrhizobium iriomotense]|uniref:Uncharacterized protein n=1 Tax=Bradyrhizobium iriomotense TaxID=441950 RepID=A0ABQ6AQ83_9BRAD|nr:hypothetical protein GCM10007857_11270 [Bradyrhizobium iriomotense]